MIAMSMAAYPPMLKAYIHRRKDRKKINRPIQADKKEPPVGLHASRRIAVYTSQSLSSPFLIVF